ncbi:LOW QUALITY PROTEIN: hypothetical protein JCM24511_09009 [Saitozyma sp. JCM 24511]|nr:LOW QUALITY PROTEIN: hypothetical protein JCM24511_09009 [Saitozyma sp. JCM 24511]
MSDAADTSSLAKSQAHEEEEDTVATQLDRIGKSARKCLVDVLPRRQITSRDDLVSSIAHLDTELETLSRDELAIVQASESGLCSHNSKYNYIPATAEGISTSGLVIQYSYRNSYRNSCYEIYVGLRRKRVLNPSPDQSPNPVPKAPRGDAETRVAGCVGYRTQRCSSVLRSRPGEPFGSYIRDDSQNGASLGLKYDSIGIAPAWMDSGKERGSNKPIKGLPKGTAIYEPISDIHLEQTILVPYAFLKPEESRRTDPDKETAPLTCNELENFALLIATT